MRINVISVEDDLISIGARRISAYLRTLNAQTTLYFAPLTNFRSLLSALLPRSARKLDPQSAAGPMAEPIADADIVAFSSMTHSAKQVTALIREVRRINPRAFIMWGGAHPIIVPEDAIQAADAVCTGEGEFALAEFFDAFKNGRDYTETKNFWFNHNGRIIRNGFRPLMSSSEMDVLPLPTYGHDEMIYRPQARTYEPVTRHDNLMFTGLTYHTVWTVGCPFKCTYCGNTKFLDNDPAYAKLRYPSPRRMVNEINAARQVDRRISNVGFHDDSFMALPLNILEEFAVLFRKEVDLPFCVNGLIPNYVRADKLEVLLEAGLNRVRMGIQSGSRRILDFYKRPTSPEGILKATSILADYSKYMIPPAYDLILDNPIETRRDVIDTLEMAYRMRRPFTLNLFSLKVQPNTHMAKQFEELDVPQPEDISENYLVLKPSLANCLLILVATVKIPRRLFDRLLRHVKPVSAKQPTYPILFVLIRLLFLTRRAFSHLRFMDFSVLPGRTAGLLWRLGAVRFWHQHVVRKFKRAESPRGGTGRERPSSVCAAPAP